MRYCHQEQRSFPDGEFDSDQDGIVWHNRPPRHVTFLSVSNETFPDNAEQVDFPEPAPPPE
jgi:hypothetical protein